MDMLDRMFGNCLRGWLIGKEDIREGKYIDYLPTRKWRYNDDNLMKDLTGHNMKDLSENNTKDVMDLSEDSHGVSNVKLRLHDNVFLSAVNLQGEGVNSQGEEVNADIGSNETCKDVCYSVTQDTLVEQNNNNLNSTCEIIYKVQGDATCVSDIESTEKNDNLSCDIVECVRDNDEPAANGNKSTWNDDKCKDSNEECNEVCQQLDGKACVQGTDQNEDGSGEYYTQEKEDGNDQSDCSGKYNTQCSEQSVSQPDKSQLEIIEDEVKNSRSVIKDG